MRLPMYGSRYDAVWLQQLENGQAEWEDTDLSFAGPWYGTQLSAAIPDPSLYPILDNHLTGTCHPNLSQLSPTPKPVPCTTSKSERVGKTTLQTVIFVHTASTWQRGCVCIRRDFTTVKSMTKL